MEQLRRDLLDTCDGIGKSPWGIKGHLSSMQDERIKEFQETLASILSEISQYFLSYPQMMAVNHIIRAAITTMLVGHESLAETICLGLFVKLNEIKFIFIEAPRRFGKTYGALVATGELMAHLKINTLMTAFRDDQATQLVATISKLKTTKSKVTHRTAQSIQFGDMGAGRAHAMNEVCLPFFLTLPPPTLFSRFFFALPNPPPI